MRAMAEAAGLRVHVFSSPHLVRFNERIRLAGKLVEDEPLMEWLDRVHRAIGDGEITHFEATTAAAILAFSEVEADVLILEVGLGGTYDATNIIDRPALSVITPVDYDHKAFLGSDLASIAGEKAGIIKAGCPAVTAIQRKVCDDVITARAEQVGAPLYRLKAHFIEAMPDDLGLIGEHQRANAALAGMAMQLFGNSTRIPQEAIFKGARNVVWPARIQKLKSGPVTAIANGVDVWLDGGHNPHAARALAKYFGSLPGKICFVTAMLASKDATGFFMEFGDLAPEVFTCAVPGKHRTTAPEDLADFARTAGLTAQGYASFEAAMQAAAKTQPDLILICGSLYLAGEILHKNNELLE